MTDFADKTDDQLRQMRDNTFVELENDRIIGLGTRMKLAEVAGRCDEELKRRVAARRRKNDRA